MTTNISVIPNRNNYDTIDVKFEQFRESCDTGLDVSIYIRDNWNLFVQNALGSSVVGNSKARLRFIQVNLSFFGHCPMPGARERTKISISEYPLGWRGCIYIKVGKDLSKKILHLFAGTGLNVHNIELNGEFRYIADITLLLDDWGTMKTTAAIKRLSQ